MEERKTGIDVEYRDAILKRLVEHFRKADALPNGTDAAVITFELLHRLFRHVVAEGYGQ